MGHDGGKSGDAPGVAGLELWFSLVLDPPVPETGRHVGIPIGVRLCQGLPSSTAGEEKNKIK